MKVKELVEILTKLDNDAVISMVVESEDTDGRIKSCRYDVDYVTFSKMPSSIGADEVELWSDADSNRKFR